MLRSIITGRFRSFAAPLILTLLGGSGIALVARSAPAHAQYLGIDVRVGFAPPPLPIYDQPPLPGPGFVWVPGYWAYDNYENDYYWVPGTWVRPPRIGYLWTPAWWDWDDGEYVFHTGYWGELVGYYGGINYGFGYFGHGFDGGYWEGAHFYYNRVVTNVTNIYVVNVYDRPVNVNNITINNINEYRARVIAGDNRNMASRPAFNGPGGVQARPRPEELAAARGPRLQPTLAQSSHLQAALSNPQLFASANRGAPPVAATPRPAVFAGPGVIRTARQPGFNPERFDVARAEQGRRGQNDGPDGALADRTNGYGHRPADLDPGANGIGRPSYEPYGRSDPRSEPSSARYSAYDHSMPPILPARGRSPRAYDRGESYGRGQPTVAQGGIGYAPGTPPAAFRGRPTFDQRSESLGPRFSPGGPGARGPDPRMAPNPEPRPAPHPPERRYPPEGQDPHSR